MCVIIAMVMQKPLWINFILLNPSTGLGQEGATRGQRTFKLLFFSLLYCKNTMQVDIT